MKDEQKTKEYKELCKQLSDAGWIVDEKHIDIGIILAKNEKKTIAIQLFYGHQDHWEWLADEEIFNNESPLWFTESSHIESPVSRLLRTIAMYSEYRRVNRSIVVLMRRNRIVNVDDILEVWSGLNVRVVTLDRLLELLNAGKLLTFRTSAKDIECNEASAIPTPAPAPAPAPVAGCVVDSDEEVDRMFRDMLENEEKKASAAEQEDDDQDSDFVPSVSKVCFAMVERGDNAPQPRSKIITHFRYKKGSVLNAWVEFDSDDQWDKVVDSNHAVYGELRDADDNLLQRTETFSEDDIEPSNVFSQILDLRAGEYWFYLKHKEKQVHAEKITIIDAQKPMADAVEIIGIGIYRRDKEDVDTDKRPVALSCFNLDNLLGLNIAFGVKSKLEMSCEAQFVVKILDELGRVVFETANTRSFSGKGSEIHTNASPEDEICVAGRYVVRIELLDEAIAETQIIIGRKDIETKYTPQSIRPKKRHFLAPTQPLVAKTPMQELMDMVGLKRLKKRVRRLTSFAKIVKARSDKGLPVKLMQLHFAFMGNPGTGKTTVAKLIGSIYKELGLLSRGHVVLRERSTLMTQSWGSEGDKVQEALQEAQGGVLFIDEAYDLATEHKSDPGKLILSALLTAMADESNRDIMIILAGYNQPMERLLSINEGVNSRTERLYFDDFNAKELMQIASLWLDKNCYTLTKGAKSKLRLELKAAYEMRAAGFGNGRYVFNLLEKEVQPAMAERIAESGEDLTVDLLTTIVESDIPHRSKIEGAEEAMAKLNSMVGLSGLKTQLGKHLNLMQFAAARRECDISTTLPPLHMVFTGNPGTGKTTVADYLGEIYRSIGLLSVGNVIKVSRADIIGEYIGETEAKMKNLLNAAHGNILFIDEAYTLLAEGNDKDFGKKAVEMLLNVLDRETCDFIVILAGYPQEMEKLIASNVGIRGRFPYTFFFEDYNEGELMQIADDVALRNGLVLSDESRRAILAVVRQALKQQDESFSNARFVVRLLTTQIIPAMAQRLVGEKDAERLKLVLAEDVPIEPKRVDMIIDNKFDEEAISEALARLDSLVGLAKVKSAIHSFVSFARSLNQKGKKTIDSYKLKWSFVGNSGTGKSTVAEILSQILKAMHILDKGHTVELRAEELYSVSTHQAETLVRERMQQSVQGLLFVDGDAPEFKSPESNFNSDHLRMSLAVNTSQVRGHFAVVIAEHFSPRVELARSLSHIGIQNFDHTLIFDDYTPAELLAVLEQCLERDGLSLDDGARDIMQVYICRLEREYRSLYANARTMSLLATAIHSEYCIDGGTDGTVTAAALAEFATITPQRKRIGY